MPLTITVHCRHTADIWCFRLSRAKFSWAWQRVCLAFLSSWCLFPSVVCSCYKLTKGKIGQKYVSVWVFSHALYLFIHRVRSLGKLRGKKLVSLQKIQRTWHFTSSGSLILIGAPYDVSKWEVLLSPLHRWRNWGLSWSNVSSRAKQRWQEKEGLPVKPSPLTSRPVLSNSGKMWMTCGFSGCQESNHKQIDYFLIIDSIYAIA